jgi:hypothetical protein
MGPVFPGKSGAKSGRGDQLPSRCRYIVILPAGLASAQVVERAVDRVFKAVSGPVCGAHAFGDKLADFISAHAVYKRQVDFMGTHICSDYPFAAGAAVIVI